MSFDLFRGSPHLLSRNLIHECLISQSIFSAATDDTHRDYSSSDLRDVHGFRADGLGSMRSRRARFFPRIKLS